MSFFRKKRKLLHGVLLDQPRDGNERCAACDAACCRGFPSVELTFEEYVQLEQLGAVSLQFTLDGRFFLLIDYNCEFLEGNRCGIYHHRPAICRRFFCQEFMPGNGDAGGES